MSFLRIMCLVVLFALLCVLPSRAAEKVLTNMPPAASIIRFEAAWRPSKRAAWRPMARADGGFVLSATQGLAEWGPKWEGKGTPGCTLPPPNDFSVRAVTKDGRHYYLTFTTHAESVWIGNRLFDVPASTSTQIVQKVESALKKKR